MTPPDDTVTLEPSDTVAQPLPVVNNQSLNNNTRQVAKPANSTLNIPDRPRSEGKGKSVADAEQTRWEESKEALTGLLKQDYGLVSLSVIHSIS